MINFQDAILNALRIEHQLATIHLIGGVSLKAYIRAYDPYVIIAEGNDHRQLMIYKHSISSIVPTKPVRYDAAPGGQES